MIWSVLNKYYHTLLLWFNYIIQRLGEIRMYTIDSLTQGKSFPTLNSAQINPIATARPVIANAITFLLVQMAVNAIASHREVDAIKMSNTIIDNINKSLSQVE